MQNASFSLCTPGRVVVISITFIGHPKKQYNTHKNTHFALNKNVTFARCLLKSQSSGIVLHVLKVKFVETEQWVIQVVRSPWLLGIPKSHPSSLRRILNPQVQQLMHVQHAYLNRHIYRPWYKRYILLGKAYSPAIRGIFVVLSLPLSLHSAVERCKCVFVWVTDFHDWINWQVNKSFILFNRSLPFAVASR